MKTSGWSVSRLRKPYWKRATFPLEWSYFRLRRERELQTRLTESEEVIEELERRLRDGRVLAHEIKVEDLCQGEDLFDFTVFFRDEDKNYISEVVSMSWDDIFRTIGPSMYGYIVRKIDHRSGYPFEENIHNALRSRICDRVGSRKIDIQQGQVDACIMQFKELGYIEYTEKKNDDGEVFRGILLTQAGERHLSRLIAQVR